MGEGFSNGVDLSRRQTQRRPDVPHGVADPVGAQHGDAGHPLPTEGVQDRVVDVGSPGCLDVEIDVGQGLPQRGEEPLHDQPVLDGVDAGDTQQIVDQATRPGAAGGTPDAHLVDHGNHVGDGQKIGSKT